MQTKSRNPKVLGMTVFQLSVLIGLVLILCVAIVLGILIISSNSSLRQPILSAPNLPPTFTPTYTPYPTYTPLPTFTTVAQITQEPTLTHLNVPFATPENPIIVKGSTIRLNSWMFEIKEIRSDPGKDNTRQLIVIFGNLTNKGTQTDTFTPLFKIILKDSQGRLYEADFGAGFDVIVKYDVETPAMMSPEASVYTAFAYDLPVSEKSFSLVSGSLISSWSGDVSFTLP
ncbi:MAG: hypothetical protein Q8L41_04620 [Anaerolineales bacterium]|nr:hypothetical protein [Anaerolineales bacterium]